MCKIRNKIFFLPCTIRKLLYLFIDSPCHTVKIPRKLAYLITAAYCHTFPIISLCYFLRSCCQLLDRSGYKKGNAKNQKDAHAHCCGIYSPKFPNDLCLLVLDLFHINPCYEIYTYPPMGNYSYGQKKCPIIDLHKPIVYHILFRF